MATMFLAFALLLLVITGMAIGVIIAGKPIKGSCGGINALGLGAACVICGDDPRKCDKEKPAPELADGGQARLFYDASGR